MKPSFFALVVLLAGLGASRAQAISWQMAFCLFGASAAIELTALGGAPITPAVLFMPFLLVRALRGVDLREALRAMPVSGFWLTLVALWGVFGAALFPRAFEGAVEVLTVDRGEVGGNAVRLFPLHPVSGNLTQPTYALGSVCVFLALRALVRREGLLQFARAALLLGLLDALAALVNLAEFYAGLPSLLSPLRNASYASFEAYEEGGLMRLQGTFPEASAFAGFTLPLFAFAWRLWSGRVHARMSGAVALALLGFLLISTSGTAYVALALYGTVVGARLAFRALVHGSVPRMLTLLVGGLGSGVVLLSAYVFETGLARKIDGVLDHFVFGKMRSSSGVERASWNAQAWNNFVDTWGLGVGMGSARASSYPLVLLSNVGLIGTVLFAVFIATLFRGKGPADDADTAVVLAARHAVLAALIAASISAGVFDLGVAFYGFAAAASLGKRVHRVRPAAAIAPLAS